MLYRVYITDEALSNSFLTGVNITQYLFLFRKQFLNSNKASRSRDILLGHKLHQWMNPGYIWGVTGTGLLVVASPANGVLLVLDYW